MRWINSVAVKGLINKNFYVYRNYISQVLYIFLKRPTSSFEEFVSLAQKILKNATKEMQLKIDLSHLYKCSELREDHYHFIIIYLINWKSKESQNSLNILKNN